MKLGALFIWLKKGLQTTESGKIGLIFHIDKKKISVEKIHNTKGNVDMTECGKTDE